MTGRRRTHDNRTLFNHILVGIVKILSQDRFDYLSIKQPLYIGCNIHNSYLTALFR